MSLKKLFRRYKGKISSLCIAELKADLKNFEKKYPNDADLGAKIRSEIKNLDI